MQTALCVLLALSPQHPETASYPTLFADQGLTLQVGGQCPLQSASHVHQEPTPLYLVLRDLQFALCVLWVHMMPICKDSRPASHVIRENTVLHQQGQPVSVHASHAPVAIIRVQREAPFALHAHRGLTLHQQEKQHVFHVPQEHTSMVSGGLRASCATWDLFRVILVVYHAHFAQKRVFLLPKVSQPVLYVIRENIALFYQAQPALSHAKTAILVNTAQTLVKQSAQNVLKAVMV